MCVGMCACVCVFLFVSILTIGLRGTTRQACGIFDRERWIMVGTDKACKVKVSDCMCQHKPEAP